MISGPLAGSVLDVSGELTIGRRQENTLRLRDDQVSRYHARIERNGSEYFVEDLGSRTGTLVDGLLVRGRVPLYEGSTLAIGQTILRFTRHTDEPFGHEVTEPQGLTAPMLAKDPRLVTLVPADATISRAGEHLHILLNANSIIASELDLEKLFEKILDQIFGAFPVHRAVIMTTSESGDRLAVRASRVAKNISTVDLPVSQSIVRRAFKDKVGVLTLDAGSDERFDSRASIVDMNIRSAICVPMIHQENVLGVIYLDTMGITHAFKEEDLRLLTGIAGPAAGAVKNAVLHAKLKATAIDTILRLAVAAEYRDDDTGFHIHRMSDYAEAIARALGHSEEFCETLKHASPMHDVGKIGIPDSILKKPGKLTKDEFETMKTHTLKGGAILANSDSDLLKLAWSIAMTHHEKYDGSGYPHGKAKDEIPIEGRIVAVADVFDAITTRRCYKPAFALEEAKKILTDGRGQHFDPTIIDCFFAIEDELLGIRDHYLSLEAAQAEKGLPASAPSITRVSVSTPG